MERKEPESVGDVLRSLLEESSLQERMNELKAIELWPGIIGNEISRECKKPQVRNGVMTIGISNSSLRQELHMNRSRLIKTINDHIGKEIIKEIKFVS